MIEALIAILRSRTSKIGESDGGSHAWLAEEAFHGHGLMEIANRYGARLINLSKMETEEAQVKIGSTTIRIRLPRLLLYDIDLFISMPVLKVHAMTVVSLGFKNQWRCIPDVKRLRYHPEFNHL